VLADVQSFDLFRFADAQADGKTDRQEDCACRNGREADDGGDADGLRRQLFYAVTG